MTQRISIDGVHGGPRRVEARALRRGAVQAGRSGVEGRRGAEAPRERRPVFSVIERGIFGAVAVCIAATAALWLLAMPDEPVRALQDGLGAAALATFLAGAAARPPAE